MQYGNVKPPVGATLKKDHPLAQGLMGCWLFNECGGVIANDYSGQNNNGILQFIADPSTLTSGRQGQNGIMFDGQNDRVAITNNSLYFNRSFCIEAWILPDAAMPTTQTIVGINGVTGGVGKAMVVRIYNDGHIRFGFWADDWNTAVGIITFGQWNHVIAQYNYITDKCNIYINGIYKGEASNGPFLGEEPVTVFLGCWHPALGEWFKGFISHIRTWNKVLSNNEITSLYNSPYQMFDEYEKIGSIFYSIPTKGRLYL